MAQATDTDTAALHALCAQLLGRRVTAVDCLEGGRNSQVYQVTCGDEGRYVAKRYIRYRPDGQDSMDIEWATLQFLWEHGLRCVPKPVAVDRTQRCAIYEYVDGTSVEMETVTEADLDAAIHFLADLKVLAGHERSATFPPASEACFSPAAIEANLQARLERLAALPDEEGPFHALHAFLAQGFRPALASVVGWCRARLQPSGGAWTSELPAHRRTLSPSDFGFHNAIRRADGTLVFLDFEHFGWDDPAKMIADVLLHPAMPLAQAIRRSFTSKILSRFDAEAGLADRLALVYPLFGLKWCLILLNEFVPQELARRARATQDGMRVPELQFLQLSKSKRMLQRVMEDYERFPYRH